MLHGIWRDSRSAGIRPLIARCAVALAAVLSLGGCGTPVYMNEPLSETELAAPPHGMITGGGYRFVGLADKSDPTTIVAVTFSGGGKRSSAFTYGILKGMRDYPIEINGTRRSLLDEVDLISSASGGSFTAAYYGLHREKIFTDYERDFLRVDINDYLYGTYLLPWHWRWMVDSDYGTNDEMEGVYDRLMFHGATYADLHKRGRPVVQLNATNIALGGIFSF